ncbi:MAG TPA: hypothetical protein DEQ73_03400 [Phycisphaerales bacterium]|nr:hypothetical protein [Phycisphaerales bacterium]
MLMLIAFLCLPPTAETAVPVHSHNDYWRSRPLQEALEAGCLSIEADVVVREGKLMVGHGPREVTPDRTLTSMYLSPLAEIVRARQRVYPQDKRPLILLVDVKTGWSSSKPALKVVLEEYADIFKAPAGRHQGDGGVLLAVSGSGSDQKGAPCGIDGRITGIGRQLSFLEKPMISQSFRSRFQWSGLGTLDPDQETKLRALSERVKVEGRLLRLWAAPDTPEAWRTLIDCGVGLINTDQPTKAAKFVRELLPNRPREASGKSRPQSPAAPNSDPPT